MLHQEDILKRPNIVILTNSLEVGGAEQQSLYLTKALHDQFDTWLLVYNGDLVDIQYMRFIGDDNLNVVHLKGSVLKKSRLLIKFFNNNHTFILFSYLLTGNFFGSVCGKIAGVRFIFGGIRSSRFPTWKLMIQLFLHRFFQYKTITNNYSVIPYLIKKNFKNNKLMTIPNCVKLPELSSSISINACMINILTVGRFEKVKDFQTSLKAIALLKSNLPKEFQFRYYIIGYGKLNREIQESIADSGLENSVEIITKPSNLADYYLKSHIYLSSSIYEGLSNSIMEAMSYGLAVVVTDVGDNGILIKNNINGFLVIPKDFSILAEKLEFLVKNPEVLKEMGKINRDKIINEFSFETFQKKYLNLVYDCQKT